MTLRAVKPGERPARKGLTVVQAAKADSHRALLAALRDRIAEAVQNPNTPAVALAALSRQLTLISKELEIMDTTSGEDTVSVAARTSDEPWPAV